jgi:hypothetical protein
LSKKLPKSVVVYQGPSRFDGAPIVAVVTGLRRASNNPKTGRMAQLWILRSDMSPLEAIDRRADFSICSDCKLRGNGSDDRACYVMVKNAPLAVYRAFKRGQYPTVDPSDVATYLAASALPIRFGAYGEPTALPVYVLNALAQGVRFTGYTHQWNAPHVARLYRHLLMASVDTSAEFAAATAQGWRTFRTRSADAPLLATEIMCPASDEMNHRTTCADCALCDGSRGTNDRRRNIAIVVHGSSKVHYAKLFRRDGGNAVAMA